MFSDEETSGFDSFPEDGQPRRTDAVTQEEISELQSRFEQERGTATGALESLIKKMSEMSEEKGNPEEVKADSAAPNAVPDMLKTERVPEAPTAFNNIPDSMSQSESQSITPPVSHRDESENGKTVPEPTAEYGAAPKSRNNANESAAVRGKKSLLEKCRPFILDDEGDDSAMHTAPTYKLESVAEILKNESLKTLDKLSQKYDISFDDLGKYSFSDKTAQAKPQKTEDKTAKPVSQPVKEGKTV